jgi:5-methylcytosine-specific restriction endonuclease McrA
MSFTPEDFWKAIILYGLNASTYKIALGKTLISLCDHGKNRVSWDDLSREFLEHYQQRLNVAEPMPQLDNPSRKTVMERIVQSMRHNLTLDQAVYEVGKSAFGDVLPRFHNLAGLDHVQGMFFRFQEGKYIELTDLMYQVRETSLLDIVPELDARWSLLEGAFSMVGHDFQLANDARSIYLQNATKRKNLTDQIPFLQGYQGNICFYCGESIGAASFHVDHVFPRQVLQNDDIWNLVLSHDHCNLSKLDKIVGLHYAEKLHRRNENIMRSNHPWKKKIELALGSTEKARRDKLMWHYTNLRAALGHNHFWGGVNNYNPESDPFYRKFITQATLVKDTMRVKNMTNKSNQTSFDF